MITIILSVFLDLNGQTSNSVRTIGGTVDVSSSGVATYVIPIETVPGTRGIEPHLSIMYNSQSGASVLGMIWYLAGLSSITRISQTLYPDNNITGINLDDQDRYALDGNRLFVTNNGNYGVADTEYGTEAETFIKVISEGKPQTLSQSFQAITEDGKIIEYGKTDDSKLIRNNKVLSWMVNKITDSDGNYMTFSYSQYGGEIWVTEINYTGNVGANLAPYAKVIFSYETDSINKNTLYIAGQAVTQSKLLSSVSVYYGNNLVRKYDFTYSQTKVTRLTQIKLIGENNKQFNATVIEWGTAKTEFTFQQISENFTLTR